MFHFIVGGVYKNMGRTWRVVWLVKN